MRPEELGVRRSLAPGRPERRLLVAVLASAVVDLSSPRPGIRDREAERLRELARRWEEGERSCPLPFAFVCEGLDLDVAATRAALLDPAHLARPTLLVEIGAAVAA